MRSNTASARLLLSVLDICSCSCCACSSAVTAVACVTNTSVTLYNLLCSQQQEIGSEDNDINLGPTRSSKLLRIKQLVGFNSHSGSLFNLNLDEPVESMNDN